MSMNNMGIVPLQFKGYHGTRAFMETRVVISKLVGWLRKWISKNNMGTWTSIIIERSISGTQILVVL